MSDTSTLDQRLQAIRLLAMDVDGVLTDAGITWGATSTGELVELKSFNARDGLGLGLARCAGLQVAWITGRESAVVQRRARELEVADVRQRVRDKHAALEAIARDHGLEREQVLYIGDDVNDLPAFAAAGVAVAVADAAPVARGRADWVTHASGGRGAVREVVERVLAAQGSSDRAMELFLSRLMSQ